MANAVLGANLYPSIHDPFDGSLLAGGLIYFYAADQVTPKDVYIDPARTTTYANPLTLDSVGQEPPIYYDTDEEYWIEIFRAPEPGCPCVTDSPIYSFFFYPSTEESQASLYADNFITNGQFSHPISFNIPDEIPNQIMSSHTYVAQAWEFDVDNPQTNTVLVNFVPLFDIDSIDSNPQNYFNVNVQSFPDPMTKLDLFQTIGYVNQLQNEAMTFSLYGYSATGSEQIELLIENIYDDDTTILTPISIIQLTTTPSLQSIQFVLPAVETNNTDKVNNKTNLRLRFPLSQVINIFITNVQLEKGNIDNPTYIEKPRDEVSARTFANHLVFPDDDTNYAGVSSYRRMTYINNQFSWYSQTGTFQIISSAYTPPDMEICAGQSVNITEYSPSGIPYARLYEKIGNTFGGNTEVVAVSDGITVTIGPPIGGQENSTYTVGTLGSLITITKIKNGLQLQTTATKISDYVVRLENLTPGVMNVNPADPSFCLAGAYGYYTGGAGHPITTTPVNSYTTDVTFENVNPNEYQTNGYQYSNAPLWTGQKFFEFSSLSPLDNTRANYSASSTPIPPSPTSYNVIRFKVDGLLGQYSNIAQGVITVDVNFSSSSSLSDNINTFIRTINNPFEYTLVINSSLTSSAGDYFLYSSITTDYYGWIRVDGGGIDPAVPGRTGTPIDILSTDDLDTQASKIASSLSSSTFDFPTQADFPTIPNIDLVYAVYL